MEVLQFTDFYNAIPFRFNARHADSKVDVLPRNSKQASASSAGSWGELVAVPVHGCKAVGVA